MKRLTGWLLAAVIILTACGCSAASEAATKQTFAMDTVIGFAVHGKDGDAIIQEMVRELQRLEKLLSRTDADSAVSWLNSADGATVDVGEEVCGLLEAAVEYSTATEGAFDITVAPVMDAWGFTTETRRVPPQAELDVLLANVGSCRIHVPGGGVAQLDVGSAVDLGGIAKGYASDRLAHIAKTRSAERGWVSLGGNVVIWGGKTEKEAWKVGIQDPKNADSGDVVGMIGLEDGFAVTSGGYQRFFEENGAVYHHIIDPTDGYPADSGLASVTVVADLEDGNGTMCDALSTALFVMGEERALEFWRDSAYDFDLVLVTEDNRVVITAGIADTFVRTEGSGYIYETAA